MASGGSGLTELLSMWKQSILIVGCGERIRAHKEKEWEAESERDSKRETGRTGGGFIIFVGYQNQSAAATGTTTTITRAIRITNGAFAWAEAGGGGAAGVPVWVATPTRLRSLFSFVAHKNVFHNIQQQQQRQQRPQQQLLLTDCNCNSPPLACLATSPSPLCGGDNLGLLRWWMAAPSDATFHYATQISATTTHTHKHSHRHTHECIFISLYCYKLFPSLSYSSSLPQHLYIFRSYYRSLSPEFLFLSLSFLLYLCFSLALSLLSLSLTPISNFDTLGRRHNKQYFQRFEWKLSFIFGNSGATCYTHTHICIHSHKIANISEVKVKTAASTVLPECNALGLRRADQLERVGEGYVRLEVPWETFEVC